MSSDHVQTTKYINIKEFQNIECASLCGNPNKTANIVCFTFSTQLHKLGSSALPKGQKLNSWIYIVWYEYFFSQFVNACCLIIEMFVLWFVFGLKMLSWWCGKSCPPWERAVTTQYWEPYCKQKSISRLFQDISISTNIKAWYLFTFGTGW